MTVHSWLTLKRFNDGLSITVLLLAMYIFLLPVLPEVSWWFKHSAPGVSSPTHSQVQKSDLALTKDERLIIPSLGMNEKINTGPTIHELHYGVWLRPNGSTPDKGGNTVMAGHRFTYTNPRGVFYYLDKVKIGDQILVGWKGQSYIYSVKTIEEVKPTDTAVEAPSNDSRLTLYTCTPLWSLKDRLVVIAERINT